MVARERDMYKYKRHKRRYFKHVFENTPKDSSKVFSQKETTSGNSISQDLKG